MKDKKQFWIAVALIIFGMILFIASFIVPPVGVIDNSILVASGEVFTFAGSIIGIDYKYKDVPYKQG